MDTTELTKLLDRAEKAVANHPGLRAVDTLLGEAKLEFSRHGWTVKIHVKGARRRTMSEISGSGDFPAAAVQNLIDGLDHWAKAIEA